MSQLPRSADGLNADARRELENLHRAFPIYRVQKLDGDASFPLMIRNMSGSYQRYKQAQGTPIAMCQALFPGKHIDAVLSFLNYEAAAAIGMLSELKSKPAALRNRATLQAWQEDYIMLQDMEAFLKPLVRQDSLTYEPWDPNDPYTHF